MNSKKNRKGFTIVELVIVIAVIAILATVLVPTFGNVIGNAKASALLQELKNEHTNYTVKYAGKDSYSDTVYIKLTKNDTATYYKFVNGAVEMDGEAPKGTTTAPTDFGIYDASSDSFTPASGAAASCTCTDAKCNSTADAGDCTVCASDHNQCTYTAG